VARYGRRVSGPLLDRSDLHVEVPRVPYAKLASERAGEPSAAIRQLQLRPAGTRRGYHRMLKLARTIADLAGVDTIGAAHVAEALQHRPRRVE